MESSACTYPLHDQSPVALSVVVGGWRKRSVRWPSGLIRRAGGSVAWQIADSTAGPKRRSDGQDSPGRWKMGKDQLTVASVDRWRAACRRFSFCRWARRVRCRNLTSPWGPAGWLAGCCCYCWASSPWTRPQLLAAGDCFAAALQVAVVTVGGRFPIHLIVRQACPNPNWFRVLGVLKWLHWLVEWEKRFDSRGKWRHDWKRDRIEIKIKITQENQRHFWPDCLQKAKQVWV